MKLIKMKGVKQFRLSHPGKILKQRNLKAVKAEAAFCTSFYFCLV